MRTPVEISAKILLAEDDNDMRRFLVKALQNAGYEVASFDNGMSAYNRLREEPFELLLTDIVMPEMDGIELARRATELDPEIKVMFITGFAAVALNPDNNAPRTPASFRSRSTCASWSPRSSGSCAPPSGMRQGRARPLASPCEDWRRFSSFAAPVSDSPCRREPSRLNAILSRHVLRVGTTGDYPPFTALDQASGDYSGLDIDLARSLGAALGAKVEFVPTTWASLSHDLTAGAFDIAMGGVSVTLERQKSGFFSLPYLRDGKTPIARCGDQDKYRTLAEIDRPDVRVAVNPGGTNERFDRAHLRRPKSSSSRQPKIFDKLAKGDADVMITDASETRYQEKRRPGVLCAVHPEKPFNFAEKAYWMVPDPALKAFVDQWLHLGLEDGEFQTIVSRWFSR